MAVTTKVERVTPARAEALLQTNVKNRKVSKTSVRNYAAAMKAGQWRFDGSPIRISTKNTLLDGQHRLQAVIDSGTAQEFLIVTGVEDEAQFVMDTGKKRSLSDALNLNGETNTSWLATLIVSSYKWDKGLRGPALIQGGFGSEATPPLPALIEFFEKNPDELRTAVTEAWKVYGSVPVAPRVLALSTLLFRRIDKDDAEYFLGRLKDGVGLAADSPILALRARLGKIAAKNESGHSIQTPLTVFALIIKAWNLYRDGATTNNLKFTPGGAKPETFPVPR